MRIGDLAHQSGVSTRALRYYEEQGLLAAERTSTGQRVYTDSAVERIQLIQQFFAAGLPSRTIVQLLPCVDTGASTPELFTMLETERARITALLESLAAARDALDRMIDIAHNPTPEHCPSLHESGQAPPRSMTASLPPSGSRSFIGRSTRSLSHVFPPWRREAREGVSP